MLEKVLAEVSENGLSSPQTLAEKLNSTPKMVIAMLDTLERMGYLETIGSECGEKPCGSCPVSGLCTSGDNSKPKLRVLTGKH